MSAAVATLGEVLVAVTGPGPFESGGPLTMRVAGAESNVAIGLARLGHPARFAGRVGADELGTLVLRTLRAEGVSTDAVVRDSSAPTGLMVKERRIGRVTRVHYYRAGSAGSRLDEGDLECTRLLDGAAIVHVTGITVALGAGPGRAVAALVAAAPAAGAAVSFDVNHRSRLWPDPAAARRALEPLARSAQLVFGSPDELALVAGPNPVQRLLDAGVETVVVKLGGDGAEAWTSVGAVQSPAVPVEVVDTVGAGDALCAGYLSGTLDGLEPAECLGRAVRTAAFAVAAEGDWEGLPRRDELDLLDLPPGSTVR